MSLIKDVVGLYYDAGVSIMDDTGASTGKTLAALCWFVAAGIILLPVVLCLGVWFSVKSMFKKGAK